jgi:hypothetical protein
MAKVILERPRVGSHVRGVPKRLFVTALAVNAGAVRRRCFLRPKRRKPASRVPNTVLPESLLSPRRDRPYHFPGLSGRFHAKDAACAFSEDGR